MHRSMNKEAVVVHVCVSPGLGGLELYSLQLHEMFVKDGIACVHAVQENSLFENKLKEVGLSILSFKKTSYFSMSNILKFRKLIKSQKANYVVVHHLKDLWFVVPALWGMKDVRVIGIAQMFLRNVNKKDFLHKALYGRLAKLLALTDLQKQSLLDCLPIESDRVDVIPNSVDMQKFKKLKPETRMQIRNSLKLSENNILIGLVGRLDPWKGQKELLIAFEKIRKENNNVFLLIIGEETPGESGYKDSLLKFISENKLSDSVFLIGFQENVHEWMSSMDIYVMPSYEEAFGIVLVEAMAAGLPCISTRAGGVPDIIISDEVGCLVEPRSSDAIYKALVPMLSDLGGAKKMGKKAQDYAFEKYDLNSVYLQVKKEVLFDV